MAHFFIHRPVFAVVVSLVVLITGIAALTVLPIAQFPQITPPMIQVEVNYPGANAETVESSIASNIEQVINGAEHMIYMSSRSSSDGRYVLQVVFEVGTNIDLANVDINNRVQQAIPRLPADAVNAGVTVTKQSPDMLMVISVYSPDNSYDDVFISNYATINLVDAIARTPGVGSTMIVGQRDYAMRFWLRPDRLAQLGITATDISNAIQEQNVLTPAGAVGQPPARAGVSFQYTIDVKGRLASEQEFGDIVVRTLPDGSILRARDVVRTELAAKTYTSFGRRDGVPSALINVYQLPGANGIETATRLKKLMTELGAVMPPGLQYDIALDTTKFVSAAIDEVIHALRDAILLVLLVVFLFLGSFRATLIPMLAVPVSLIGTFAAFVPLGFSINTLTLFAIVLAVGIVVDDAIVVVEAVQHHIEHGISPLDATERAMKEVSGPVVAIALVLCAVFVPVAFIGGITGQLYRQFALTLSVSVLLSALVALSLTPALCRLILKPQQETRGPLGALVRGFNRGFGRLSDGYLSIVRGLVRRLAIGLGVLLLLSLGSGGLAKFLPSGFVPDEDLGYFYAVFSLPDGASLERTSELAKRAEPEILRTDGVQNVLTQGGFNQLTGTYSSNNVSFIVILKPWEQRKTSETQAASIIEKLRATFAKYPEALSIVAVPPPIPGLGSAGGLQFEVQDRGGHSAGELYDVSQRFLAEVARAPEVSTPYSSYRANMPQLRLAVDRDQAKELGIAVSDIFQALQVYLGGLEVNDFNLFGRTYKVVIQAEPQFRATPNQIGNIFVRTSNGDMVPISAFARIERKIGPDVIQRYNMFRSAEINSSPAPGFSTGQTISAMETAAAKSLPPGYSYEWTGTAFQEKQAGSSQVLILGMGLGFVFLFLAAQYESWAIPFGVMLGLPLGIFGALAGIGLRGLVNDVYAQIGIVMLMGLAAKNAILIVEFARNKHDQEGMPVREAAIAGAKLRFRPILMTSFAFILGVIPLVIASGAGSASRQTMGTAVFGGMTVATCLGVFIIPVLYCFIELMISRRSRHVKAQLALPSEGEA
ncbi:MAG: efflux RND transporter permease subunit [Bryobacterales bacterium]|nr:efflux RND transporter permease subunit [Bryobacterales bacterium]